MVLCSLYFLSDKIRLIDSGNSYFDRVLDEISQVVHTKLAIDIGSMGFHRPRAYRQRLGYLST